MEMRTFDGVSLAADLTGCGTEILRHRVLSLMHNVALHAGVRRPMPVAMHPVC